MLSTSNVPHPSMCHTHSRHEREIEEPEVIYEASDDDDDDDEVEAMPPTHLLMASSDSERCGGRGFMGGAVY